MGLRSEPDINYSPSSLKFGRNVKEGQKSSWGNQVQGTPDYWSIVLILYYHLEEYKSTEIV